MILVTGSSGFIGSHLKSELSLDLKNGDDILTCDLPEADIIIHLAAQTDVTTSVKDPFKDALTNILGTIRLARFYKDKRFIFASSGGAIQEKIESPYGLSKFCAEEYIKLLCKDYVILRFPNIYGEGSKSVVDIFKNGEVNIYGDGSATRDYVHVSDIIEAIDQAIHWKSGVYHLGSGKNYSVLDLAKATGKPIHFLPEREGELLHSFVKNNTNWSPKINVINYIKSV